MAGPMIDGTVKPGTSSRINTPIPATTGTSSTAVGTRASGAQEPLISARPPVDDRPSGFQPEPPRVPDNHLILLWNPDTEQWENFLYRDLVAWGELPARMYMWELNALHLGPEDEELTDGSGTGSWGSGSSGGAVGPIYVKPDKRVVTEAIRATMAALAGRIDQTFLDELVGVYMGEHRRSFDQREVEQVDPMETVKEKIRATSEYKAIHQLRPDSTDEYDWITSRQGALKRAGVSDITSETLGIAMATAGANDEETVTAGNVATFSQSGQQLDELKNRIRTTAYGALQLV